MAAKVYAVAVGRRVGVFDRWDGPNGAQAQVNGFKGARHHSFTARAEAAEWLAAQGAVALAVADGDESDLFEEPPEPVAAPVVARAPAPPVAAPPLPAEAPEVAVHLHSEAGVDANAAYAVLLLHAGREIELAGAHAETTPKRQLVRALAEALASLKCRCRVTVHAAEDFAARRFADLPYWLSHNWECREGWPVQHADQWARIAKAVGSHEVSFAPADPAFAPRLVTLARGALVPDDLPRDYAHPPWQEAAPE